MGSGCVTVSGAGTPPSPFRIALGSACLPVVPCTSSSRPISPSAGQIIFETDTKRVRIWRNSTWQLLYPNQTGLFASGNADIVNTNNGIAVSLTVNPPWDVSDTFQVLVMGRCALINGGSGDVYQGLMSDNNGSVYSEQYFNLSSVPGVGSCSFEPSLTLPQNGPITFRLEIFPYSPGGGGGGGGMTATVPIDSRYNIIHALAFAV